MRMCLVHGSSDVHRIKVLIAILEEDDASSLKMKNNYRPMLGLYLVPPTTVEKRPLILANNKKRGLKFLSD